MPSWQPPDRPKTRVERGLPEKAPKKPKAKKPRHDGYDGGHARLDEWVDGTPCPVEGCDLPIFNRARPENVKPCPLGRGCETIPARFA